MCVVFLSLDKYCKAIKGAVAAVKVRGHCNLCDTVARELKAQWGIFVKGVMLVVFPHDLKWGEELNWELKFLQNTGNIS